MSSEPGEGQYASIAAEANEGRTLDFGPLFNPAAFLAGTSAPPAREKPPAPAVRAPRAAVELTQAEGKETLRRAIHGLVAHVSSTFGVDHKLVHATLNARCGGPAPTATAAELERRRQVILQWFARRTYDGLR